MNTRFESTVAVLKILAPALASLGSGALYGLYFFFCVWRIEPLWFELACRRPVTADHATIGYAIVTSIIAVLAVIQTFHYMRLSVRRARNALRKF